MVAKSPQRTFQMINGLAYCRHDLARSPCIRRSQVGIPLAVGFVCRYRRNKMQIRIYIHPDLGEAIISGGPEGAKALARITQQAVTIAQQYGGDVQYAPAMAFPNGQQCAMSVMIGSADWWSRLTRQGRR